MSKKSSCGSVALIFARQSSLNWIGSPLILLRALSEMANSPHALQRMASCRWKFSVPNMLAGFKQSGQVVGDSLGMALPFEFGTVGVHRKPSNV